MKYLDDIDTDEICETLGITVQNYWVLMHRAKIQLRTCLEKNWINS
jgi:RNA polymerase sigma-70 factor (ECF subfamily)